MKVRAAEPQSKGRGGPFWCSWAWCWVITCRTPMNEALELCRLCDERTLGLVLALLRRCQGSSVSSVIANLEDSAEHDSALARNVLSAYQQADAALQNMAAGTRRE
jgi:hypothetical protein